MEIAPSGGDKTKGGVALCGDGGDESLLEIVLSPGAIAIAAYKKGRVICGMSLTARYQTHFPLLS